MKSINNIGKYPASIPLLSDDIIEFHAARLLLLFRLCGMNGSIEGLTKMAKLDFFVRYPNFFYEACEVLGEEINNEYDKVESRMIRYHYGPWDRRYYQVLGYLRSRGLIYVDKNGSRYDFCLTSLGNKVTDNFLIDTHYISLIDHIKKLILYLELKEVQN